jgi:hypothetical protein
MGAIGDQFVNSDIALSLGCNFAHAVGEMGTSHHHAMFSVHVFVKHQDV